MQDQEQQSEIQKYLTITLEQEQFALDINRVSEVLDVTSITKVPGMPDFVLGVIDLRGQVVPVIDLRKKLEMGTREQGEESCIVLIELQIEGESVKMGALTDSVDDVLEIESGSITPPPKMGTHLRPEFIQGMIRKEEEEKFIIVLDIEGILSSEEVHAVKETGEEAASAL